jgi:hypothetical protein
MNVASSPCPLFDCARTAFYAGPEELDAIPSRSTSSASPPRIRRSRPGDEILGAIELSISTRYWGHPYRCERNRR